MRFVIQYNISRAPETCLLVDYVIRKINISVKQVLNSSHVIIPVQELNAKVILNNHQELEETPRSSETIAIAYLTDKNILLVNTMPP